MAQRSHVPKFGNWDGDNVPYTAYFENARKEKAGGIRMNPNDPAENPEAFMFGGFGGSDDRPHSFPANSVQTSLDMSTATEKYQSGGHKQHRRHQRNASDQQKSVSQKSTITSESGSEKSNSDYSTQQLNRQRKRSDRTKSSESSNGFTRPKGGSNLSDDLSSRSASVPKFGAWDEKDPKSGEGFTVIFNKVKEDKQIAAVKFPPVQPQTSNNRETQSNKPRSKMFCCLFASD